MIGVKNSMNKKTREFVKNFSYTLAANITSLLISTLAVMIIPKVINVEDYGYWQLYIFYTSYVGFFQFGWNDGIYLRYGGKEYNILDKELLFSQFWMLAISQFLIAGIIIISTLILFNQIERKFVLIMVAICMIILGVRAMLLFILQATNRIKEYAHITMAERVIYLFLIASFLVIGVREFKLMIVVDLVGKLISLLYAMYCCRDIVFRRFSTFYFSFKEAMKNINVGIKLMFANIAGLSIVGVVRFGIERCWDVSTFGKVSFTLSVSNLMMLFINAVGIIMFPVLKRTDEKKLSSIYATMRDLLMIILFGLLILYYPLKVVLSAWLPKFSDSLMYMALVFPMCIFEGKMAFLINTYLKTLRREKLMLKINLISLAISIVSTYITTVLFKNLSFAIVSIVILLLTRCVLAEMFLSGILTISLSKDIALELVMTLIFIITGWYLYPWFGGTLYIIAYIFYLVIKRNDVNNTIINMRLLMKM